MKLHTKKSLLAGAILLSLNVGNVQAATVCTDATQGRNGEVPANQEKCLTDYGHYLYVNVPYENSDVTITTSGGTFNGIDADITLYDGSDWSGAVEQSSATANTNDESISFVSRAGQRYFYISGDIAQTHLLVSISGGDIPPPMGDYIIFDTNIVVDLPAATLASKAEYAPVIADILVTDYNGFKAIAGATPAPISDVSQALHYLASNDDLTDPDLNQLLYFMGSYKYNGAAMTDAEAAEFSIAMQAVAKMSGFLGANGGTIQEGYARAINNFERGAGSAYFANQLPHLLALIQYHSLQTNPFAASNAGNAIMESMTAIGNAALYGDAATKKAFSDNMLDVLSVMRSFALLGETSLDMRWADEADKKWIMPHSFMAIGKIAKLGTDEAKQRFDSTILEIHTATTAIISKETVDYVVTKNYLAQAGRQCDANDPLFGNCFVPPKIEDVLTVNFECTSNLVIRAQESISQATLDQSCLDLAEQEAEFHTFFNTGGTPVANDNNARLEVVAFASPEDYEKYAGEFFGIDTDNGGMYLEGTPSSVNNQPRFIAMQCPDAWVGGSCQYIDQIYNLKHEFVHYLDGRYNKAETFGYYNYNVSWAEGFSEYLPNKASHARNLATVKGETIPPLYNLLFMAYGYDDLYPWSYFSYRYLSEEHPSEVQALAQALRAGDTAAYNTALATAAERAGPGFEAFMLANTEAVAPAAVTMPAANTIGSCDLIQRYVKKVDANKTELSITNTTETPLSLFWISSTTGEPNFSKNYKTLNQGESYVTSAWSENDRMVLTDNNLNCVGVAVLAPTSNDFTIDAELVKDVIPEVIPALDQLGSCDLAQPHLILDKSHEFTITNTSDTDVRLFRIDNMKGTAIYTSGATEFTHGYGTLAPGESYTNDIWYGGRRLMVTDTRLNCLSVGVLNNPLSNYTIDQAMVANAATPEIIPAPNTIGTCDLMGKHLTGPFEADFSFTNTTSTPVRIHRVDNLTGELSESFGFTTIVQGETYTSADTWKWFGNRRAAITDESNQCLGVAVMTEKDVINDYQITAELVGDITPPVDSDGDGVPDSQDVFPNDPNESKDSDGDGVGDNGDAFPNDASETKDSDGDGVGDNADAFPNNATETKDSDGDGVGDNSDAFPNNATETVDSDGDGVGNNSDAFPNDATESVDSDGDGYGDNSDIFPNDATEWIDTDGDGTGDNSDPYPNDPDNNPPVITDCGTATISSGKLTLAQTECVSGGRNSFYVWVENDNTKLDIATTGGNGDVSVYFNSDTWATQANAQSSSANAGSTQNLQVVANRGWRYITLNSPSNFSGVSFTVAESTTVTEPPAGTMVNACATQNPYTYGAIESGNAVCTGNGRSSYYIMIDSSVNSIEVNTAHGTGAVSLFTGTSWPDANNNDFSSTTAGTTEQSITINNPPTGWYYISVVSEGSDVSVQVDLK